MSNMLHCEIITPEAPFFQGDVTSVVVPAFDGLLGIQPGHAPLVSKLGVGIATVHKQDGSTERIAVRDGFLRVNSSRVTLLAVHAVRQEQVPSVSELDAEAERVSAAMAASHGADEHETLTSDRDWVTARKTLAAKTA